MAKMLPKLGGAFVQAVSEVAAVNMMYGAGAAGVPSMTFTEQPGLQPHARGDQLHDRSGGPGSSSTS